MNRKHTARWALERPHPKLFLPKNNSKNTRTGGRRRAKARKQGARGGNLVSAGRVKTTEVIEKSMPLFGARSTKRLRYSTNIQLASTSGAVTSYVFAANGLYDPDITGTGHQPMGFDEMMLYYNHFVVTHCNIQVIFKGISSTKLTVGLRQDGAATPLTTIDRIVEMGGSVIDYLDITSSYGCTKRLQLSLDIAKLQGISRSALTADSSLRGTVAANPAELTYVHVQVWDAAGQTGSVNCDVIIDFVAVFTEPRDITSSLLSGVMAHLRMSEETVSETKNESDRQLVKSCWVT